MTDTEQQIEQPKRRIITLTNRPPVAILEHEWPQLGRAQLADDESGNFYVVTVRRHQDGRVLVYGICRFHLAVPKDDLRAGQLLEPYLYSPQVIADRVRWTTDAIGAPGRLYLDCLASMPAEEI